MDSLKQRYILHDVLGAGGMGVVYRATDRLTQATVALKRVHPEVLHQDDAASDDDVLPDLNTFRLVMAREFQTLASLRHPNIIEVLDYGFDSEGLPFFTMTLIEEARNVIEAAKNRSIIDRLKLAVQLLRALSYLHRRRILHRDIKPNNVLVTPEGRVMVLDFGLATQDPGHVFPGGSLPYLAPEIMRGGQATVASDLYAVGIMLYEMLLGKHPFTESERGLIESALEGKPDLHAIDDRSATLTSIEVQEPKPHPEPDLFGIDNLQIAEIIRILLRPSPQARYASAADVIEAISIAIRDHLVVETPAIQEQIIQRPEFVGREEELGALTRAVERLVQHREGSAFLIAGESGVGKTRLMEEVRIRGLVAGALVVQSQVGDQSVRRDTWGDVPRRLALSIAPTPQEANILRPLIPDIHRLTGVEIEEQPAPPILPVDSHLHIWQVLLSKQKRPVVVILENLDVAAIEVMETAQRMIVAFSNYPVMWICTFRDDEFPSATRRLSVVPITKLQRLDEADVGQLCAQILDRPSCRAELLELLMLETGGNPLFIVETMRALVAEMGGLEAIVTDPLPERVKTGLMSSAIKKRLTRVPAHYRELLIISALIGRRIDVDVLSILSHEVDVERWLTDLLSMGILTTVDSQWYFAHEQIREGIPDEYIEDEAQLREFHKQVAEALEAAHGSVNYVAASLTYHYRQANARYAQRHYSSVAGEVALDAHLYRSAAMFLQNAIALMEDQTMMPPQLTRHAYVYRKLSEAYFAMGQINDARLAIISALTLVDDIVPTDDTLLAEQLVHYIQQRDEQLLDTGQATIQPSTADTPRIKEQALCYEQLARIELMLAEAERALYAALRGVMLAEQLGFSPELARLYAIYAETQQVQGNAAAAARSIQRALQIGYRCGNRAALCEALLQRARLGVMNGDWESAGISIHESTVRFEQDGNRTRLDEGLTLRALIFMEHELDFEQALQCWETVISDALLPGDATLIAIGYSGVAGLYYRNYHLLETAIDYAQRAQQAVSEFQSHPSMVASGIMAAAHWMQNDTAGALLHAQVAVAALKHFTSHTVLWRLHAIDLTLQTLLDIAEQDAQQKAALKSSISRAQYALSSMTTMFPIAIPFALRSLGIRAGLDGEHDRALNYIQRSIEHARTLQMPLQIARGLVATLPLLRAQDHRAAIDEAVLIYENAGSSTEMIRLEHRISRL